MSDGMVLFKNDEFCDVQVVTIEGVEWFIAKPITDFLGFSDAGQATRYLDDDEKTTLLIQQDGSNYKSNQTLINESGLYSLILRSRKPEAKKFKKWITSEVLPSIRKHGGYLTAEKIKEVMTDPSTLMELARVLQEEQDKRKMLESKIERDKPKVEFADAVGECEDVISVGSFAKFLHRNGIDIGSVRLFKLLREEGYLMTSGRNKNVPKQKFIEMGLFKIKETVITHNSGEVHISITPLLTGKGQHHFIREFFPNGIPA